MLDEVCITRTQLEIVLNHLMARRKLHILGDDVGSNRGNKFRLKFSFSRQLDRLIRIIYIFTEDFHILERFGFLAFELDFDLVRYQPLSSAFILKPATAGFYICLLYSTFVVPKIHVLIEASNVPDPDFGE